MDIYLIHDSKGLRETKTILKLVFDQYTPAAKMGKLIAPELFLYAAEGSGIRLQAACPEPVEGVGEPRNLFSGG